MSAGPNVIHQVETKAPLRELVEKIMQNGEEGAVASFRECMKTGVPDDELLRALVPAAACMLEMKYDTPHGMIALEWVWSAFEWLSPQGKQAVLECFVRCLARGTKLNLSFDKPYTHGKPYYEDHQDGMERSLASRRVLDATFYMIWLLNQPNPRPAERHLLELAGREVDPHGHVFIYTASALRLFQKASQKDKPLIALAIAEYLARKAQYEKTKLLTDNRTLESFLPRMFECPGDNGENILYAAEMNLLPVWFSLEMQSHFMGQLDRNIEQSRESLTIDEFEKIAAESESQNGSALERLEHAFISGSTNIAFAALVEAWNDAGQRDALRELIITLFARIDAHDLHFIIYPAATFSLLHMVDDRIALLALGQLVRTGSAETARRGLRHSFAEGVT